MSWTGFFRHTNGTDSLYAMPLAAGAFTTTGIVVGDDTGQDSLFVFAGLDENKTYEIRVQAGVSPVEGDVGISTIANVASASDISDRIERAGGPLDSLNTTALTGPHAIDVTVLNDDDSSEVENALVRIYKSGSSESKYTASDGTISAFAVSAATWKLAISADGFTSQVIELTVSGDVSQTCRLVPNAESVASSAGWIG